MKELPLIVRARTHGDRIAIRSGGTDSTYADLLAASAGLAASLLGETTDLAEARIAFIAPAGFDYFFIQWAIWRAGGVAVPLSSSATEPELEHVLSDSQAARVIAISGHAAKLAPLCGRIGLPLISPAASASRELPEIDPARRAMILYTSGTTSKPKGVVTTHATIQAQIEALVTAWEWSGNDRIPLFLPMHHVHGIINIAACALWSGATVETFAKFETAAILDRVAAGAYSVFMAVPTIYVKLIEALQSPDFSGDLGQEIRAGFAKMRLMVSGSAALPPSVHGKWHALTGQSLLERYGMTETGMMISNPYHGERRQGSVGLPLPGVEIRLKSEHGNVIATEDEPGEIQARGPAIFSEYWNRPETTAASFDDGWFRTGDMAVLQDGYYRIMGRLSSDIIKSGAYKLSALEIEAVLVEHPAIRECAVIGVPDETWGELVVAAIAFETGAERLDLESLNGWCKNRLSPYKIPRRLVIVNQLPRNAMGKVTKRALVASAGESGEP